MRRAGWAVWLAYDLPGSYEEMPPNLVDELKRDRRWCQGNLINSRLFWAEGLHAAHRAVFATGVMSYLSALLWFMFLVLSTVLLAVHTLIPPVQLDEAIPYFESYDYIKESMQRSLRWAERAQVAHKKTDFQGLFGIVQGAGFKALRTESANGL